MNLYIRLLLLKLRFMLHRKPAGSIEDELLMSFVCGLSDIDLYMHMNNSRYLAFMDLGRIHFIRSIGAFEQIQKQGWLAIVGGVEMQYRRPVGLFQRFQLKTRILCWD